MSGDGRLGEQVGRYRIDSVIGRGGFASVYRAQDTVLDRPVALKMLDATALRDPTNSKRFLREGRTAANLDHAAIVPVYDAGDHEGTPWLAMRLVDGGALDQHLASGRPFAPADTLALVQRIASALDHAHGQGLVHRDVKPSNILLENGRTKTAWLTDFGIAVTARNMGLYTTGALGTAAYMAPEQARPNQAGPPADLYSLGCVTYELLTGRRPFPGEDYVALLMAHANDPVPPTGVATLDGFMERALAKTIEGRPDSGRALARDLAVALDDAPDDELATLAGAAAAAGAAARGESPEPAPEVPVSPQVSLVVPKDALEEEERDEDGTPAEPEPGVVVPAASEALEAEAPGEALTVVDQSDRTLVHQQPQPLPAGAPQHAGQPQPGGEGQAFPGSQPPPGGSNLQAYSPQPGYYSYSDGSAAAPGPSGLAPQSSSGAGFPAARPTKSRRIGAAWLSVLAGAVLLVVAIGTYFVTRDTDQMVTVPDTGAYYDHPADWTREGGNESPVLLVDDTGATMVEVTHRETNEDDIVAAFDGRDECVSNPQQIEPLGGSESMATCDTSDGAMTVGALAFGRFWIFTFDGDLPEDDRNRFLNSLEFFDYSPSSGSDSNTSSD